MENYQKSFQRSSSPETIEKPPVQSQFLIFTLFGDYILPRGGKIWTKDLLHLMEVLGMSERAVRSVLSRLTRKGWLSSHREGRHSRYSLTTRGRNLLEGGARRIFEPLFTNWEGEWHMVIYSLPEEKRSERHSLRTQLSWLGFGRLAPGAWISPHDRNDDLRILFTDLDVEPFVDLFSGRYLGPYSPRELIQRCWDIDSIGDLYRDFIARYSQEYADFENQHRELPQPDDECYFINRYWLTHDFQALTLQDPNLPTSLLPPNWIGFRARDLFDNYRLLLNMRANQFVDNVMTENPS